MIQSRQATSFKTMKGFFRGSFRSSTSTQAATKSGARWNEW